MKSILLITTIVLTSISCSRKIDLKGHYDPNKSFEVYHHEVGTYEFQVNEERHTKLLSWLESNNKNWKPTRKDWGSLVIISQENFTLLLFRGDKFAVVVITDDENITRHYSKMCNNNGFHILDE
jgi:hypothetical protein